MRRLPGTVAVTPVRPALIGLMLGFVLAGLPACVAVVEPRYPDSVATGLATRPMRRLEGEHLRVYYPDGRQDEARRFLRRVDRCARYLRGVQEVHNGIADAKMTMVMPEAPLNNAFVYPRLVGYDTKGVVPTFMTADLFSLEMGQPPDPAVVGCHEITHYVQAEQVAGFSWFMNTFFGAVYSPQLGLDSWFQEGLAVYYETKLIPGTGRLAWPLWRGMFAAAYAGRRINGGDLHFLQRDFYAGNAYLVGSQFIRFLADRYGEQKLWRLIHKQARAVLFPFAVNVRFWQAYDKSLSTLIDEFADEVSLFLQPRARPSGQRLIREAGANARYARARDGTEALIVFGHDSPTRLMVYGQDGALRQSRQLIDVVPPRDLAMANPALISGLSFTDDGQSLYFVAVDIGPVFQVARLIRYDIASDRLTVVTRDIGGAGGAISPDGGRYAYARVDGDHHDLAEMDVRTRAWRVLAVEPHGAFVSGPRYAPDGRRLVASEFSGDQFRLVVFDAASGRRIATLEASGRAVHDPSWIDDHRILYLGAEPSDAGFQGYVYDLNTGRSTRVTNAPFLAFQARADAKGTVRFLNREGWRWTLDEVTLAPAPSVTSPEVLPAADAPAPVSAPASVEPPAPPQSFASPRPTSSPSDDVQDVPASALDGLFVPRLHGLTFQATGRRALATGLVLAGHDRLEKHRWALAGYWQSAGGGEPSVFAGYSNRTLAPLTITATAAEIRIHDVALDPDGSLPPQNAPFSLFRRDRMASLDVYRTFWDNPVGLGLGAYETYRPGDAAVSRETSRFAGLRLFAKFSGVESTPYTGDRRAVYASVSATVYPESLTTIGTDVFDARADLATTLPLPLLARHTLFLRLRGRGLFGTSPEDPLLVVGGLGTPLLLARRSEKPEPSTVQPDALPPRLVFSELLTGFEDHPFLTDRVAIAGAFYSYPFIIDWGTASTLGILPAMFVRQVDLTLFGSFATDGRTGGGHAAVGGSLTLDWALWMVGLGVRYQMTRRLTDDHALVHLVLLGV